METYSQSSICTDYDRDSFFCCTSCKDKEIVEYAVCYCERCRQCFCRQCCGLHDQLFSKHVKYDRGNMKNWPVSKELEAFLRMCQIHTNKRLERFCKDCCMMCCSKCAKHHRQCRKVTLESAKKHAADVNELSLKLRINIIKLKKLQSCCESRIQDLKGSYHEQELMVRKMHKKIYFTMDKLVRSTLKKTAKDAHIMVKTIHESMHSTVCDIEKNTLDETRGRLLSLRASINTSVETCILYQNELKTLNELLLYSSDKNKKKLCFIAVRRCVDKIQQVETYMEKNWVEIECSVLNHIIKDTEKYIFQFSDLGSLVKSNKPQNDIEQYLSRLSGLSIIVCSNYVFTVRRKSEHKLEIPSDSYSCMISALCILPGGEILVLDRNNKNIKLLNQHYQVVSHCGVAAISKEMCRITPREVALTVNNSIIHEVQFITVNTTELVTGRTIQLQHTCNGISHHQGDLFITSDTALYKYSLSGKQISKLYEDESGVQTVWKCAVSPKGDKLYIINTFKHMLLTLARDGSVLATFSDPKLKYPDSVNVTPAGQVLVCYTSRSNPILQVHSEGSKKLATLGTHYMMNLWDLEPVYFNSTASSIIVGCNNTIIVFNVQ